MDEQDTEVHHLRGHTGNWGQNNSQAISASTSKANCSSKVPVKGWPKAPVSREQPRAQRLRGKWEEVSQEQVISGSFLVVQALAPSMLICLGHR